MARSLTVISLLLQSTTHCRYRVYTKFLLTYTAIYRGNRKVEPLGITALQPRSHFHLGTTYKCILYTDYSITRKMTLDDWLPVHCSITLFDLQLGTQNSYLFTYNTFIKILYMFRALPCSSSGGLRHNCIYAASGNVTACR
jgi:hypothetical protein